VGDSIRLTPEVYLGRRPGQFYRIEEVQLREALTMLSRTPRRRHLQLEFCPSSPA
jgi:hypothetical protein